MSNALTRRNLVSALPSAVAVIGLPTVACAASDHPDSNLLALDTLLAVAKTRRDDFAERCDETYGRVEYPPVRDELLWRGSDFPSVWVDPHRLDFLGYQEDGQERYSYAAEGVLEKLHVKLARWRALPPLDRNCTERDIARVEEIIAGVEAYRAEEAERLAVCGFTAANEACDAECAVVNDLLQQILSIPSRTPEGVCVKARALLAASYKSVRLIEKGFPELLAKSDRRPCETEELAMFAIMIDAARLGTDVPSNERSAA